jgi:hypothetical protein
VLRHQTDDRFIAIDRKTGGLHEIEPQRSTNYQQHTEQISIDPTERLFSLSDRYFSARRRLM